MRFLVRRPVPFLDHLMPPSPAFPVSRLLLLLLLLLPAVRLPAPSPVCNATFANRLCAMAHV